MEQSKPTYFTSTQILSLAGTGNICLCQDYPFEIEINNITYPTLKHAVLSFKTKDVLLKKQIAKTRQPADLKDLEMKIIPISFWKENYILSLYECYTFIKFEKHNVFNEVLIGTYPMKIIDGLMENEGNFDFKELRDKKNYYGKILMTVRKYRLSLLK